MNQRAAGGANDGADDGERWTCPTCEGNGVREFRPFCSARCANRDLGRWLDGSYVVAGDDQPGTFETDEDEDH